MANRRSLQNGKFARALRALDRRSEQPSFLLLMSVFPLIGYLVPLLPTQLLLVTLSFLHRSRWLSIAISFLVATSAGAFLTSVLIQSLGGELKAYLVSSSESARQVANAITTHGLWAVAVLALLPWPPRTAVLICAFVGLNPMAIAISILAGRTVPTFLLSWLAASSPDALRRVGWFGEAFEHIEQLRKGPVADPQ